MKFKLRTLEYTQIIAKEIASFIKDSNGFYTFLLYGNLGTGKTTLVKDLIDRSELNLKFSISATTRKKDIMK